MPLNHKLKRKLRRREMLKLLETAEELRNGLHDIRTHAMFDHELIQNIKNELLKIYLELKELYEEVGK